MASTPSGGPRWSLGLLLWAAIAVCATGCKAPDATKKRVEQTLKQKAEAEEKAKREAQRKAEEDKARAEAEEEARKKASTVQASSGAVGVGEPIEPFVKTEQLSANAELRDGLEKLARGRPTKGLLALLAADKKLAREAAIQAMWHESANVRSQAPALIGITGGLDEPAVVAAFKRSLRKEQDRDVRSQVAKALVTVQIKALVPVLIELLQKDGEGQVRANAAYALGAIGDKQATDPLIAALADTETWVRLRSVTALRRLRASKATLSLEHTLSDPNVLVREAAVRALKTITGKSYKEKSPRLKL